MPAIDDALRVLAIRDSAQRAICKSYEPDTTLLNTKSANPLLSNLPPPSHQVGALGPRTHLDDGPYVALHRLHGCLELGRGLHHVEDVGCFLLEDGAEVVL